MWNLCNCSSWGSPQIAETRIARTQKAQIAESEILPNQIHHWNQLIWNTGLKKVWQAEEANSIEYQ